mmetsp:Transcript_33624/g.96519  ORF Transcript_33624/g.96519 Transcript_33624/m.96519 type:complete len:332 (-) Transcript_33624:1049-2044(-)
MMLWLENFHLSCRRHMHKSDGLGASTIVQEPFDAVGVLRYEKSQTSMVRCLGLDDFQLRKVPDLQLVVKLAGQQCPAKVAEQLAKYICSSIVPGQLNSPWHRRVRHIPRLLCVLFWPVPCSCVPICGRSTSAREGDGLRADATAPEPGEVLGVLHDELFHPSRLPHLCPQGLLLDRIKIVFLQEALQEDLRGLHASIVLPEQLFQRLHCQVVALSLREADGIRPWSVVDPLEGVRVHGNEVFEAACVVGLLLHGGKLLRLPRSYRDEHLGCQNRTILPLDELDERPAQRGTAARVRGLRPRQPGSDAAADDLLKLRSTPVTLHKLPGGLRP